MTASASVGIRSQTRRRIGALFSGVVIVANSVCGAEIDFNRDIRPLLSENCFYCHGQDGNKRKAGLRLDGREAAVEAGAIHPEDPAKSLLLERLFAADPEDQMPPPGSNRVLTDAQRDLLKRWVKEGAPYQNHWAYVKPERPAEPNVRRGDWPRNAIDRFVLAKLETLGVSPSPEANRETLIKRLSIDLTGLPPTPEEVSAFVQDPDPSAYERLVDRLMNSRHYGERMALPWLDAARYADSNGFQQDGDTWQWIWRDWVVKALNEDLPFDRFTLWQLAGDLLPNPTTEQLIASGFNRNHLLNGEGGAIPEEQRFVNLFDRVDTTATTWLGLTMACAQCHDHKYDPITQRDYYRFMDAFNRVPETGRPQRQSMRIRVAKPFIEMPTEENKVRIARFEKDIANREAEARPAIKAAFEAWRDSLLAGDASVDESKASKALRALLARPADELSKEESATQETELKKYFEAQEKPKMEESVSHHRAIEKLKKALADYRGDQIPRPMVMSDAQPRQTHILNRGAYLDPLEKVSFGTPSFLPPLADAAPANRLGLAQWLISPEQPLTARVQVNRMWQHFFGQGIVKTAEDFGVQSEYPVHLPLLDWLAVEFRERGWSMKQMHRLIVTSATYRQSSRLNSWHREQDRENRYYARASRFRMPSMLLRDWALAASGLLVKQIGGAPVYPYQPDNVWEALAITKERDFTYPASSGGALYRRSLYTFWRRTVGPVNMFDSSDRQACRVRLSNTSTPLHALTTLNDPTWVDAARGLAGRAMGDAENVRGQLRGTFFRVLCREPNSGELDRLVAAFERQLEFYQDDPEGARLFLGADDGTAEQAAMTAVCLGLLNLDEALNRE